MSEKNKKPEYNHPVYLNEWTNLNYTLPQNNIYFHEQGFSFINRYDEKYGIYSLKCTDGTTNCTIVFHYINGGILPKKYSSIGTNRLKKLTDVLISMSKGENLDDSQEVLTIKNYQNIMKRLKTLECGDLGLFNIDVDNNVIKKRSDWKGIIVENSSISLAFPISYASDRITGVSSNRLRSLNRSGPLSISAYTHIVEAVHALEDLFTHNYLQIVDITDELLSKYPEKFQFVICI